VPNLRVPLLNATSSKIRLFVHKVSTSGYPKMNSNSL
jgi:hypothetical protein